MAREAKFKFVNYDGGLPVRPAPERKGSLVLDPTGKWELHFPGGFGKKDPVVKGGVRRNPLTVTETSPNSCRVTIHDGQDPTVSGSFDLPNTPASAVLEAIDAQKHSVATIEQRHQQISSGSWWLAPDVFRAFGLSARFDAGYSRYLGGWSGYTKTHTSNRNKYLVINKNGISLSVVKTLFTIPWDQVLDIEVEGPESASKRVTAGRALAFGVFALAAKKNEKLAVLIVQLRSGEEAIFDTRQFTAGELRAKLVPVTSQLRRARGAAPPPVGAPQGQAPAPSSESPPAAALSVADELKKLAELKDAGVLTDDEFAQQKTKLLGA